MTSARKSFFPLHDRSLLWQFAKRDVLGRYRASILGLAWSFINPLLMLGVYSFVFVGVFRARWPGSVLQIFAGLLVFNLFAEVASRAPNLIVEQPNLVKKVIFPVELLTWVTILSGLFHFSISVATLLVVLLFFHGSLSATVLALPLILLSFIPFLLGLSWFLAAGGVFIRDVGQMMTLIL